MDIKSKTINNIINNITGSTVQQIKMIEENTIEDFENAVNMHLLEGYELYDKMVVSAWTIGQGVVKRTFVQELVRYIHKDSTK